MNGRACGSGSTTSRNGEGCSSSLRTAVTTSRSLARVTATWNSRVSSCRTCARAARESPPRPVTASTRSAEPSSEPRSRRSGHTPSCTPATTTRSHSSPAEAAGVTRATDSPAGARGTSVSPATSWPRTESTKSAAEAPGSRSTKRAAASKRPSTASRSRSARPPAGPPASAASRHGPARPLALHIRHSTASTPSPSRRAPSGRGEDPVHPPRRSRLGPEPAEGERLEHRLGEEHVAGPAPALVELEAPQRPTQAAQQDGVRTTDRGPEDVDDVGGVEALAPRPPPRGRTAAA